MVVRLNNFLLKLAYFPYIAYKLYNVNDILFITLCSEDDLEKYVILEPVPAEQRLTIIAALEYHKQQPAEVFC